MTTHSLCFLEKYKYVQYFTVSVGISSKTFIEFA